MGNLPWIDQFHMQLHTGAKGPYNSWHRLHGLREYGITRLPEVEMMSRDPGLGVGR